MKATRLGTFLLVIVWALSGSVSRAQTDAGSQDVPQREPPSSPPWEKVLDRLRGERDRLSTDLEAAHAALLARAETEDPSLVERLSPVPPRPRPWGYGYLPEVEPSSEERETVPQRQVYSLRWLSTEFASAIRGAGLLEAADDRQSALEPRVAEFERLRARLRQLERHLSYHAFWQRAVIDSPDFFARKNEIIALVREWRALVEPGSDPERRAALAREIADRVAGFRPTPGLSIERRDGLRTLAVRVVTDIGDETFLEELRTAVSEAFADSPAARSRSFQVELTIERIPPEKLFPEGVPERGARIGLGDHLDRFPAGALVLTTGAKSTHAGIGRFIRLGPHPRSHRSLAHEFGHLLGFGDAYLRGYEGSPGDPFGCVLVEWSGLVDNLMGSPGHGRVTGEMIDRLIAAYSEP